MLPPESFLGPEDAEHHVMFHHIEVPRDDGALVRVLNENLVNLKLKIKNTDLYNIYAPISIASFSSDVRNTLKM